MSQHMRLIEKQFDPGSLEMIRVDKRAAKA
jgi:hypothetical protein